MRKMILPSIMMALIMMLPLGAMSQSGIENYVSASGCVVYHAPVYHTGTDGYVFDFEADYDAEHLLECTVMDADGDGNNWSLSPVGEGFGHNGSNGMLMSYSYNNVTQTALSPNNFLVLPQITITANNKMLTFFARALDDQYPADHFGVAVSTTSNNVPSAFAMLQEWTMTAGGWHQYSVNLSSYVGQNVYIAIRHFNSTDNFCLCVDDIVFNGGTMDPLASCSISSDGVAESVDPLGRYHFLNTEGFVNGSVHSTIVQAVYQSGVTMQSEYAWTFRDGDEFLGSPTGLQAVSDGNQVDLTWTLPAMSMGGNVGELYYDFADSTFSNLTLIDANNDGKNWVVYPYYGYGGGNCIKSASWQGDQLNPDNFLVTPKVTATSQCVVSFMAHDSGMPGIAPDPEHFGIAVSTGSNTNASDFVMVQEWNSTGTYTQYTADLSAYAGQEIYIALRHFNTTGSTYYLIVDDIHVTGIDASVPQNAIGVNVYSNNELIAMLNHGETSYTHMVNRYNAEYCIRVIQNGNMETGDYYALAAPQCANVELDCVAPKDLTGQYDGGMVTLSWERKIYTGFEEDPDGWTFLDADGDGQVFGIYYGGGMNADGSVNTTNTNASLSSFSYLNGLGSLTPDNYAFMPKVKILEDARISFYASGYDPRYPSEHFGIAVADGEGSNIVTIAEWNTTYPYSNYTVDLSDYAGQEVFVGFRHFTTTSNYAICIDNITLTNAVWAGTSSVTVQYNIYSSTDNVNYSLVGSVDGDHTSFQFNAKSMDVYYQVTAVNTISGGVTCESNPAMSADGIHNYVQLTVENSATQTITLTEGWNWISANVEITLDELKEALVNTLGNTAIQIKSKDETTSYNGTRWRGTLNSLDVACMYKINVNADIELTFSGTRVNPAGHPVTIHNGANWIAYPLDVVMSLDNAFEGFAVSGDMVKSKDFYSTYSGRWRGTLDSLEPGKGLIYKSNATGDRALVFPNSAK